MNKKYKVQFAKTVMKDGNLKTYWPVIGAAFEDEKRITISLDSLPLEKSWDGRLFLYEQK